MLKDGVPIPSVEQLEACALRQVDLDTEDGYKLFEFYHEKVVAKGIGNHNFGEAIRKYHTISEALVEYKSAPVKKAAHPRAEAFLVLVYENNYVKWHEVDKWIKEHPGESFPKRDKNNPELTAFLRAKWTDQDGGQVAFVGWDDDGLDRFDELNKAIKAGRNEKVTIGEGEDAEEVNRYEHYERKFLQMYQQKKGIKGANPTEEKAIRRREGRAARGNAAKKRKLRTMDSDDDDSDEEDKENNQEESEDSDSDKEE